MVSTVLYTNWIIHIFIACYMYSVFLRLLKAWSVIPAFYCAFYKKFMTIKIFGDIPYIKMHYF